MINTTKQVSAKTEMSDVQESEATSRSMDSGKIMTKLVTTITICRAASLSERPKITGTVSVVHYEKRQHDYV